MKREQIYIMVLLALIAFKISSATIHMNLHHNQDEEEHCELCEHVFDNLNTEFSTTVEFELPVEEQIDNFHPPKEGYQSDSVVLFFNNTLFGRPPPSLI